MKTISYSLSAILVGGMLAGCSGSHNQTTIELIQDMMDQRSLKSQDYDDVRNQAEAQPPPEGTVPRGFTPYKYATDPLAAEANLVNPLAGDNTEKTLERGKNRFETFCSPCHGMQGHGDGTVAQYMSLKPPPLISDKVKNFKDGRIFHIITAGQGVMSSYATQVFKEEDRWAIVKYVRVLQKNSN
jgi:mono/diheme cytochrome c family protein